MRLSLQLITFLVAPLALVLALPLPKGSPQSYYATNGIYHPGALPSTGVWRREGRRRMPLPYPSGSLHGRRQVRWHDDSTESPPKYHQPHPAPPPPSFQQHARQGYYVHPGNPVVAQPQPQWMSTTSRPKGGYQQDIYAPPQWNGRHEEYGYHQPNTLAPPPQWMGQPQGYIHQQSTQASPVMASLKPPAPWLQVGPHRMRESTPPPVSSEKPPAGVQDAEAWREAKGDFAALMAVTRPARKIIKPQVMYQRW